MRRLLGFLLFLSLNSFGLTTQYVSFEHPEGWRCELSQGVFICQSQTDPDRKESIVMSIATIATEWDSLDNYENYLNTPKTIQDEEGNSLTSKVTVTRRRNINGTVWIDSLQYNSELPGFWSRYLATVQNKLAILITYIVSDEQYSKMAPQFERMIASLKPNSEFDLNAASSQGDAPLPGGEVLGSKAPKDIVGDRLNKKKNAAKNPSSNPTGSESSSTGSLILVLFLVVGVVLYMRMKKRKKPLMPKGPNSPTNKP